MMLGTAPAAALAPAGFFMRGRILMLGWIALALMLWLAAAMRAISGPRQAAPGAATSAHYAASPESAPVIPAKMGMTKGLQRRGLPTSARPPPMDPGNCADRRARL